MKFTFFVLFNLLLLFESGAQKYGNIWYFGKNAGIDFNSCTPLPLLDGQNKGFEGCATICNSSGQLLFYTNSDTVWNKQHQPMPNGNLIQSGGTLSQVLILSKPGSDSLNYIITTKIQATGALTLQYHVVNMNQNSGLGDVISKNNVLSTANITEQIAATTHSNGLDVWIMVHEYPTNNFLAFLVNSSGINSTPVVSTIGTNYAACISNFNARGEMKFSPDCKRIAINNNGTGTVPNSDMLSVFNFDNSTGVVSNEISLPVERGGFGISFSPDNSKLYAATWKAFGFGTNDSNRIVQFDLSSGNPATIANSKAVLISVPASTQNFGAIKLAPNGKIYVASNNESYLGVIQSPDLAGTACNFVNQGFYLGQGVKCNYGLNNYIEYKTYCSPAFTGSINNNDEIILSPNPFNHTLTISCNRPFMNSSLSVMNMLGEVVLSKNHQSGYRLQLDRNELATGLYFLQIQQEGRILCQKKIMISND